MLVSDRIYVELQACMLRRSALQAAVKVEKMAVELDRAWLPVVATRSSNPAPGPLLQTFHPMRRRCLDILQHGSIAVYLPGRHSRYRVSLYATCVPGERGARDVQPGAGAAKRHKCVRIVT